MEEYNTKKMQKINDLEEKLAYLSVLEERKKKLIEEKKKKNAKEK